MFGGLCFRPLELADEGLGLAIDIEKSSIIFDQPESPPQALCFWDTKFGVQTSNFPYIASAANIHCFNPGKLEN